MRITLATDLGVNRSGVVSAAAVGGLLLRVYDAWALQQLWNWFVAPAMGTSPIPFATAIGITLAVTLLTTGRDDPNRDAWRSAFILLEGAVRVEKEEDVREALDREQRQWWVDPVLGAVGKIVGTTVVVVVGWVIRGVAG